MHQAFPGAFQSHSITVHFEMSINGTRAFSGSCNEIGNAYSRLRIEILRRMMSIILLHSDLRRAIATAPESTVNKFRNCGERDISESPMTANQSRCDVRAEAGE